MTTLAGDQPEYFNPVSAPDFLMKDQLQRLQLQRLKRIVKRAYDNVELTRNRMDDVGINPEDIKTLADISKLPFVYKSDLRDTYPYGLFASPMSEVVRLHASSGTTGKPTVVAYTQDDIDVWSSVMQRAFASCGVHAGDIVQNSYGYGLFTGGLGAHYGAEALGATVIPVSGGNTDRQLMIMKDFGANALCATPSYFLHIIDRAEQLGIDLKDMPLRVGIFGAEPWSEPMRTHCEAAANMKAYDIYGLSEIIGPGVGSECRCQKGLHIFEDHFYPEIIDPETGEVLPEGQEGELVLTTLSKDAMPMIRYRTRDITSFITEPCECGRTLRRINRIGRRSDDMLVIRGVNLFPSQIESALLKVENAQPHYQIILTKEKGLDQLEIEVELTAEMFSDQVSKIEQLQKKITHAIETTIGISAKIRLVEPNTIARSEGKAKRVIDKREQ
ncbi:MAG: phenylacetate--CoA ligase [Gammaproteobacteria bacterium]|nr:MAG: phenylacetate--CoA ligase [Gammaproteobacteria bacterium]